MQAVKSALQITAHIQGVAKREKLNMQVERIKAPVQILISNAGLLQRLITKLRNR